MKKVLITAALLTSLAFLCGFMSKPAVPHVLTVNGTVTAIDSEYVYIDTADGNGYVLYYTDWLQVGDSMRLTFDTKGNSDLYDDELIELALLMPVE